MTFLNVCVILNPTTYNLYKKNKLNQLSSLTLSKLYVAITRAKGNLYFIEQEQLDKILKLNK